MGFFSNLFGTKDPNKLPDVISILPSAAVSEINAGRLPQINSDKIFLKSGEICHLIDKAILIKEKVERVRRGMGYSMPGLFKGDRIHFGRAKFDENVIVQQFRGIIYITNKRIIFQANKNAFDKPHTSLSAITPYTNAVALQYGSAVYELLMPDGALVKTLLDILRR